MGCHFTEEVSRLVDGELSPHEAARLSAHLEGCAACGQAREAFLLLRQELRCYESAPDPHAQSRALASILGSHTSGVEAAAAARGAGRSPTPREPVRRFPERLAEAFGVRGLRPAHVATLALLLIGTVLGWRWFMSSHTPSRTHQSGASAAANANGLPVQAPAVAEGGGKRSENPDAIHGPTARRAKTAKAPSPTGVAPPHREGREHARVKRDGYRTARQRREGLSRDLRAEVARAGEPTPRPPSAGVNALYTAESLRSAADPGLRIGRHAERVERLLRSFRNARLTESDPTLDVADARRLSKRLLYSNIALRREAASAGDRPVEGLLDSLEPILIDISNLPNTPSPDAVGSIKERIHRQHLVGALQTQVMPTPR